MRDLELSLSENFKHGRPETNKAWKYNKCFFPEMDFEKFSPPVSGRTNRIRIQPFFFSKAFKAAK